MKKFIVFLGVLTLVMASSLPARADDDHDDDSGVKVEVDIRKDKDVDVTETVNITKNVDIDVRVNRDLDKGAEADASLNQKNEENSGCENCAEKLDKITDNAFKGDSGLINVNQSVGNMNNQGNVLSVAIDVIEEDPPQDPPTPGSGALTHSQAAVVQEAEENAVDMQNIIFRDDLINGQAFQWAAGVINVNQAAGNMNNQGNTEAIALGFEAAVALADVDLGQRNKENSVDEYGEYGVNKSDIITNQAFENVAGVVGVNQAAGNINNQANSLSLSAVLY